MKKFTKSAQYLRYLRRHARRSLAAKQRFDRYRKQKNREENYVKLEARRSVRKKKKLRGEGYTVVQAPQNLSFVRNPDEVSSFIQDLKLLRHARKPVFVGLKNVREMDYDGITVLLSAVVGFQAKKIAFNGDFPSDIKVKTMIEESGFFNYINDFKFKDEDHYELSATKIYTHAKKNVDSFLGMKVIEAASRTVWGSPRRCPGVQRVLIELMQNTNNHASNEGQGEKHWWLSVKHIREEKRVVFSFLDYGVGVFMSLRNKKPNEKFHGTIDRLAELAIRKLTGNSDANILKFIFEGELHRTASGKTYRGKGLPGVYQALERHQISNLAMITNGVVFNSATNSYSILSPQFSGTFVSWELNENNVTV